MVCSISTFVGVGLRKITGAGSVSNGDGSRAVSEKEKVIARFQGKHFATTVATYIKGKESLAGLTI